ncbi:copper resistance CopC family protein [Solwaraspora sp. WMMB335]|uniref:copper resistance CopC family protein n=1 Tax=Solwaraspora sp. WMMB335 TaxID=3404118 RepID=UPI003B958922
MQAAADMSVRGRRGVALAARGLSVAVSVTAVVTAVVAATLLVPASPAAAHNALVSSQPGQNTRVAQSPEEIELVFIERLNGEFTTIVVSDAAGAQVPIEGPVVDQQRGVVRPVEPLPDGVYTVAYRVVSTDGHPVQGSFRFAVNAPLVAASGAAAASAAADGSETVEPVQAQPEPTDGLGWWPYLVGGVVLVIVGVGVGVFVVRRRRVT